MSTSKYTPHLLVLPEDDANRQLANGFIHHPSIDERAIQILPPAGGWGKVIDEFERVHAYEMRRYSKRNLVLMIDFDNRADERLNHIRGKIPSELSDRVFVLGVSSEPEKLKARLDRKSFEDIGKSLAQDCADNTRLTWGHDLLKHNEIELDRMASSVKPFLFSA